eukprot:gb/GFBE01031848.1/.p1 GENE.gb/GFBE01031848.1/~~gb/GFBE01031848.1/.p1  ORF type:complete len:434 (+),score=91.42 gb/GFBE01031848.1/:1-1302(+)
MRNIALLEWGPASLFYIQPRELIKVRSKWLDGGPVLPPFLSTMEEAKAHGPDIVVRYALSAFEDLNSAIKNLRRCFGFPYQEYIGYLNTLTQSHRARREHEALIERLRRWAMFGNVDAVFWIDYAKANQPPGSFKMGPRESRPFSPAHMQLVTDVPEHLGIGDLDDESEAAWSEQEDEEKGQREEGGTVQGSVIESATLVREQGCLRPFPQKRLPKGVAGVRASHMLAPAPTTNSPSASLVQGGEEAVTATFSATLDSTEMGDGTSKEKSQEKTKGERELLRTMLQEEFVPGPGSIYTRSIVPGPGYYGAPKAPDAAMKDSYSFGRKGKSKIEEVKEFAAKLPGPGQYAPKPEMTAESQMVGKMGCMGKAPRLVPHDETARKLPFISKLASASESYGLDSSLSFHCVNPIGVTKTPRYSRPPEFSFSKTRRPF